MVQPWAKSRYWLPALTHLSFQQGAPDTLTWVPCSCHLYKSSAHTVQLATGKKSKSNCPGHFPGGDMSYCLSLCCFSHLYLLFLRCGVWLTFQANLETMDTSGAPASAAWVSLWNCREIPLHHLKVLVLKHTQTWPLCFLPDSQMHIKITHL